MKSDREFLRGVYERAEMLKKEEKEKKNPYIKYLRYSSLAALVIILPLLIFQSQIWPTDDIESIEPRMVRMLDEIDVFLESDYIVIGEISKIQADGDFHDIVIDLDQVLFGEIEIKDLVFKIPFFLKDNFKIGDRNLFFLYKEEGQYRLTDEYNSQWKQVEEGIFEDQNGNKYNLQEIEDKIKGED